MTGDNDNLSDMRVIQTDPLWDIEYATSANCLNIRKKLFY